MKRILALVCVVVLAGCSTVQKQAYNREANRGIKQVALIEGKAESGFGIQVENHPGLHFGLIGASLYAAEMATKSNTLDSALKPFGWSLTGELYNSLAADLEKVGYQVTRISLKGVEIDMKLPLEELRLHPALAPVANADAWLSVGMRDPLYVANGTTANYLPSIYAIVRMISPKDKSILFFDAYAYGFPVKIFTPVLIPSDNKYQFENMEKLTSDPAFTLEGIKLGVPMLVKRIVDDVRP